jgi:glyoxylase-like metal-dependent hydrolase (beta-lactamase superfamily II)
MGFSEVVPGVYAVSIGWRGFPYLNAFVIDADGVTLVDTGLPKRADVLLAAVTSAARSTAEVRNLAVTHCHTDHIGSLAALVRETGATAYVHPLDAPVVRGERSPPRASSQGPLVRLTDRIAHRIGADRAEPCPGIELVQEGQELDVAGGLHVLHTPGHTAGHVSYLLPSRRVLFVGDAAGCLFGRVGPPVGMYTEDMDQAKQSIRRLASVDFDAACFGHGTVLRGQANSAFRRLVEKLAA